MLASSIVAKYLYSYIELYICTIRNEFLWLRLLRAICNLIRLQLMYYMVKMLVVKNFGEIQAIHLSFLPIFTDFIELQ